MGIKLLFFLPFIEIISFIFFGDILGFVNTLLFILITGIFGFWLFFPKRNMSDLSMIAHKPEEWLIRRLSGILLIIPGFCTDVIGLLLLFKSLRFLIMSLFPHRYYNFDFIKTQNEKMDIKSKKEQVIDAEYKNLDD